MVNLQNANTIWVSNFWAKNFFLILRICMLDCWILSERNNDPSSELMDLVILWRLDDEAMDFGVATPVPLRPLHWSMLRPRKADCWHPTVVVVGWWSKKRRGFSTTISTIMGQCPSEKRSNKPLDGLGVASVKNGRQRFLDVICSKLYSTQLYVYTWKIIICMCIYTYIYKICICIHKYNFI